MAIRVGGHIRSVNGDCPAHLRVRFMQSGEHPVKARGQHVAVVAQLRGEPVARPVRGSPADDLAQHGVLADQPGGTSPGRKAVDRLDERRAHHHADRVAGTPGPADLVKISDEPLDLGQFQQRGDMPGVMTR